MTTTTTPAAVLCLALLGLHTVSGQNFTAFLECASPSSGVCRVQCLANEISVLPFACSVYSQFFATTYYRCVTSMPCCYWGSTCQSTCNTGQREVLRTQATCSVAGQVCCIDNTLIPTNVPPLTTTTATTTTTTTPTTTPTATSVAALQGACGSLSRVNVNSGGRYLQLPQGRLVGGVVAGPLDWPWMVRLTTGSSGFCAGVLVDDNTVVTAAHCVSGVATGSLQVILGDYNLRVNEGTEEVVGVFRYVVANGFQRGTRGRDFAVLKLSRAVTPFTNRKLPACLPDPTIALVNPPQCYVAGWGVSEVGLGGPLRAMNVQLMDRTSCQRQLSVLQGAVVSLPSDIICTNNPTSAPSDGCLYDDGDMLVCRDVRGRWSLVGVMSEYTCGRGRGLPVLFTDVRAYTQLTLSNLP